MPESPSGSQVHDVCRVESPVVSCDGAAQEGAGGHPLVYLTMGERGHITCPYCSREFVLVERS
jgi:uncharacterized Zn-finger protein